MPHREARCRPSKFRTSAEPLLLFCRVGTCRRRRATPLLSFWWVSKLCGKGCIPLLVPVALGTLLLFKSLNLGSLQLQALPCWRPCLWWSSG